MGENIVKLNKNEEYITLQSALQVVGVISTGGMAKIYLAENNVSVNDVPENRRGRKLYSGDKVCLPNMMFIVK